MCPPHPCGASPAVAGHENPPFRRDTKRPLRGLHESHGNMTIRTSLFQLFNLAFRVRVRPKADFVSREAGFRVRRKRRRCGASQGHGMAAAMLAWVGAVPGQQNRQLAVRRDGGFRGRAPAPPKTARRGRLAPPPRCARRRAKLFNHHQRSCTKSRKSQRRKSGGVHPAEEDALVLRSGAAQNFHGRLREAKGLCEGFD